jgi:hypothetical protein
MKTLIKLLYLVIIPAAFFASCGKKNEKTSTVGALGANYPNGLNSFMTPAILDTLKSHGMAIHAGLTPPSANGIYLFSPDSCTFDNSGENAAGTLFDAYLFQFSNQNSTAGTIDFAYTDSDNPGSEVGFGYNATYISGTSGSFTIYAQVKDTLSTGDETVITLADEVVSGTIVQGGIQNMQLGLYSAQKSGDPNNEAVPVGTTRVFLDEDGFSQTESTFSIQPGKIQALHALFRLKSVMKMLIRNNNLVK